MLKNKLISSLLAGLLFSVTTYANEATNINVDSDQNEISQADMDKGFKEESIFDWISDFEDKMDISIGTAQNGRTFFAGTAVVRVNPLDPAYAKELSIAYEKAMLDLQANFILQTYGRMVTERVVDFFENDSTNAGQFDSKEIEEQIKKKNQLNGVFDKMVAVIGNSLDAKLEEQGVEPDQIAKSSLTQKQQLYKDNFKKAMVKKAVQSISGLVPIQTKVVTAKTYVGNAIQIGVIAVMSEKTVQFAKDISRQRATNVKGKPKNIKAVLPKNKEEYLNEFGLRYLYDDKGRPMLLSYGRWSVVGKSKDPAKYLRKVQSAKSKARMFAESYIGEFMKSNIQVSQSVTAESVSEEIAEKVTEYDGTGITGTNESSNEISETIDKAFKNVKAKSTFKLRGTSQLKTWQQKDKNGILHVGSVVTWTYDQLENANNIARGKFKKDSEIKKENTKKVYESKESAIVNDIDDF